MRWDKSWCVCSRAFDNLPTSVNWWGTGQTLGAWGRLKTALPGSKGSVRGTTTRGQTSVVSSEGQWYLTSSVTQLMAQSAVPAASHTENCEQFKHQRVVTTLRSASKRWRNGLTAVLCSSQRSAKSCACGGITPCKNGMAWKPNSQKRSFAEEDWSSNKLNTSQEAALAKATSPWAAPEQQCQHFGSGDPSSHASSSKHLDFCFAEELWNFFKERFVQSSVL